MKTFDLTVQKRTQLGKKDTKSLRANEKIPCVLYGGDEVVHFFAHENAFRNLIYTSDVYIVELDIEGKKHKASMKEIQFHPVTDIVLHIDFIEVFDDKAATVTLPITISGNSVGILAGGKLRLRKRFVTVKGFVKDLPENINIDITNLKIGDVIKVGDLKFENLEFLDPAQAMVVGVATSRLAADDLDVEEGEEGAEEEGAEEEASSEAAE